MKNRGFEGPKKRKEKPQVTRRELVATAGALAAIGGAAALNLHKEGYFDRSAAAAERPPLTSERYERACAAYRTLYGSMTKEQVLFVDAYGGAIGEPRMAKLIQDEDGSFNLDQTWLDEERARICQEGTVTPCDPAKEIPRQLNLLGHLQGEVESATYMEIIRRNGHLKNVLPLEGVIGKQKGDGLSRIQYVRAHVKDSMGISDPVVANGLARLAPALIGQESGYHNKLTSGAGATRAAQFMPETMKGLGVTDKDLIMLRNQVEAMGKEFTTKYTTIAKSKTVAAFEAEYFPGNRDGFVKDFLLPVVFTSYNAGQGRMVEVVLKFLQKYPTKAAFETVHGKMTIPPGRELCLTMLSEIAKDKSVDLFGKDASTYWISAEGLAEAMIAEGFYQ